MESYQTETAPSTTTATERRLAVSTFRSALDNRPALELLTVDELARRCRSSVRLVDVPATDDEKKRGPAFALARFRPGTTRAKANVEALSGYVVDLDGLDDETIDAVRAHLTRLHVRALLWSTWGDRWRKAGRCVRVVVPFAVDVDAARWPELWPALNDHLALGHNDPSTRDASRLHFFPRSPRYVPLDGSPVTNAEPQWFEIEGELFDPTPLFEAPPRTPAKLATPPPEPETLPPDPETFFVPETPPPEPETFFVPETLPPEPEAPPPTSAYARAALEREAGRVLGAREGERNSTLNGAAFNLGQLVGDGELPEDEAVEVLRRAGRAVGLDDDEIEKTIRSGLQAGKATPRSRRAAVGVEGEAPPPVQRPRLSDQAFHGPLGEIVRAVDDATEADPAAVLVSLIAGFGMLAGRTRWASAGAVEHHARHFVLVVGDTAAARKGTSWAVARQVLATLAPTIGDNLLSGVGSGEGLIDAVRDATPELHKSKDGKYVETVRPGITDKRLLILETEFARLLAVAEREGAVLSPLLRDAWDGSTLRICTRTNPIAATDPHLCVVGHITADELRRRMATVELFNGLANRFLFVHAGREKILPFGADLAIPDAPVEALRRALDDPACAGPLEIEGPARDLWEVAYREFAKPIPGVLGHVLARRDAITLRLALTYAIADNAGAIRLPHLEAALAVIEYATASANVLFGDATGDKHAERILAALKAAGAGGLTRSQLSADLSRNVPKHLLDAALLALEAARRARRERRQGAKGAPAEVWLAA